MRDNVEKALANVETLEDIEIGSERLAEEANKFRDNSSRLKCKMCRDYYKFIISSSLIVLVVIFIIYIVSK